MFRSTKMPLLLAGMLGLASVVSAAPILGQVDSFEDGLTAGWSVGAGEPVGAQHPAPPQNVATGGPAGAGDNYLQLTALGATGPGSRLSAFNMDQWAGDYLSAGITALSMDVRNFGPQDVVLRLLLAGPFGPMGPQNAVATSDSISLAAGGGWVRATFSLRPEDLVGLLGTAHGALSQAGELRLFHNPAALFLGPGGQSSPAVAAVVGIDNVTAVPEPAALLLLGLAVTLGEAWRQRRPTRP